jgi:hypothetical protein
LSDPRPKFVANPINIPPLIKFVLNVTKFSTLVVGGWITFIPVSYLQISAIVVELTLLMKLNWFELDNAPLCGDPLVSSVVQNVDVNTPLVLYSWTELMDEFVDFMVPINLPTPCLSIYYGLHEFLVLAPMIDPLMFLPYYVTSHVYQYLLWCEKAQKDNPWLQVFLPHIMHKRLKFIRLPLNPEIYDPWFWLYTLFDPILDFLDVNMIMVFHPTNSPLPLHI